MTKYRWREPETWRDRQARNDVYRGRRELEREQQTDLRAGLRPHLDNPDDPWSRATMRACEVACEQHQGSDPA